MMKGYIYIERKGKYYKKARDLEKCDQFADYKKRIVVTDIDESLLTLSFWYKDMQL